MSLQLQQVDAGAAAEQVDMAAMITSLNDARRELNFLRDGYERERDEQQNEIFKLNETVAKQAEQLRELEADREIQAEDFDATSAAQSNAYNELRIAYEQLLEANTAQRNKSSALEADLERQKADSQSASQEVATLRSAAASQDQAYKDLQPSQATIVDELDAKTAELVGVNADKEAQAEELAQLKVAHQSPIEQLARFSDPEDLMTALQSAYAAEREIVAELSASNVTQSITVDTLTARLDELAAAHDGLTTAHNELIASHESRQLAQAQKEKEVQLAKIVLLETLVNDKDAALDDVSRNHEAQMAIVSSEANARVEQQAKVMAQLQEHAKKKDVAYEELAHAHQTQSSLLAQFNSQSEGQVLELNDLRNSNQAWAQNSSRLSSDLANANARYNELHEIYGQLSSSFSSLAAGNTELKERYEKLNAAFSDVMEERNDQVVRCEQLKADLCDVKEAKAYQVRVAKRTRARHNELRTAYEKLKFAHDEVRFSNDKLYYDYQSACSYIDQLNRPAGQSV